MIWNDTSTRQGLVQEMEDLCGLGATGITGNTTLFQQFTRWANNWQKIGFSYAIRAFDGHDVDDPAYTTLPSGTFAGATTRDYNLDGSYKMLKFKVVNISYDGTNYVQALPVDDGDFVNIAKNDPNIDYYFNAFNPKYDLTANGFNIYPKFTAAQVSAGAKVFVEFYRAPREFATTGTDSYEPGLDLQFHKFPALGAALNYCELYKPDLAPSIRLAMYGNGGNIRGMLGEIEDWYSSKSPNNVQILPRVRSSR